MTCDLIVGYYFIWVGLITVIFFRVAKDVGRIVRENGATPATVAVIAGKIHVGRF